MYSTALQSVHLKSKSSYNEFIWTIPWLRYIHVFEVFWGPLLKPLHTLGKVSVNASILYKNQEIGNKTILWKFQLILLFLLLENSKNVFSIFVFILMAGVLTIWKR